MPGRQVQPRHCLPCVPSDSSGRQIGRISFLKYKVAALKDVKYVGIDEFSIRKGHSYMSIFVDLETGRILHAVEGKSGPHE